MIIKKSPACMYTCSHTSCWHSFAVPAGTPLTLCLLCSEVNLVSRVSVGFFFHVRANELVRYVWYLMYRCRPYGHWGLYCRPDHGTQSCERILK